MAFKAVLWTEIYERLNQAPHGRLYGIARGGSIVAGLTRRAVDRVEDADWLVGDVIDSKATFRLWTSRTGKPVWALYDAERDGLTDHRLVMPWDRPHSGPEQYATLERIGVDLIEALGYDSRADDLQKTPARWARWWQEFSSAESVRNLDSRFEIAEAGRMVIVGGMRMWSICEHHLLPFLVDISIAYVPRERVLGLSKLARLSLRAAHRLQLQERLTAEIADATSTLTSSCDVAVLVRGRHLCMEARGVKTPALATSFIARGAFDKDPSLRAEFIALQPIRAPGGSEALGVG